MATSSLIATTFATRAGTRILMRAGDDGGVRSLRRRRRRGGSATAQRSAVRHRNAGGVVLGTPHARRAALRRLSARARLVLPSGEMKLRRQEGRVMEGWGICDDGQQKNHRFFVVRRALSRPR